MKTQRTILSFVAGLALGIFLVLGFGASGQNPAPTLPAQPNWSNVSIVSYPSGTTGIFDPSTGRLFLYDAYFENCFSIRQLTVLGEPMRRLR